MVWKAVFDYDLAKDVIDEMVGVFSPKMIIVFGSVARDEAEDRSDLDLLVVMDTDLRGPKRSAAIHKQFMRCPLPMDIPVLTPEEFESNKDNKYSFASEIVKAGVVAYEA